MEWDFVPFAYGSPDSERDEDGYIVPLRKTSRSRLNVYLSKFNFRPDDVLYDLGCGNGKVLERFAAHGCPEIHGVELNPEIAAGCDSSLNVV